ncbi:DNA-binding response regulator, OmpR family, contains REC and winged-helix (wHTH) domain [Lachnospiraceae bacterium KH1T2]|nr:DNA-binding response regulator, OmpR family, contains REC and winged-helix (wHTH) domain [Lachnospiraceae bacterium KH1T2]
MYRILMVDDDTEVLEINRKYFEEKECRVEICDEAERTVDVAKKFLPDCILLDVMMPEMDGFQVCRELRKITQVPILFLSGKVSEDDKIFGFESGADDYIEKPYSIKEVYVRIVSNIRRSKERLEKSGNSDILTVPPLKIETRQHKVYFHEEEIAFSTKEYDILIYLANHVNIDVTYEEIGKVVWGVYDENDRRSVMVYVSRLRKKLKNYTGMDNIISTVWSKGYRMEVH